MTRTRFLFATDVGDPISCISISDAGCMAGSMLGRVWQLRFAGHGGPPEPERLAGYSEDGVRGLHIDAERSYTTLLDKCQIWKQGLNTASPVEPIRFTQLDRKSAQSVKHVLQRGPWVCVLFSMSSTVVNILEQRHHHRAFKLMDFGSAIEIAPCDFDGESLVVADRSSLGSPPVFRVVQLERNDQTEVDAIPDASRISIIKLWRQDYLVYVIASSLYIYDMRKSQIRGTLRGHKAEILAVDTQDDKTIVSMSADGVVNFWNDVGDCLRTLRVPEATFFLGFPYFVCACGQRVLLSADEGVFLAEIDSAENRV